MEYSGFRVKSSLLFKRYGPDPTATTACTMCRRFSPQRSTSYRLASSYTPVSFRLSDPRNRLSSLTLAWPGLASGTTSGQFSSTSSLSMETVEERRLDAKSGFRRGPGRSGRLLGHSAAQAVEPLLLVVDVIHLQGVGLTVGRV